MKHHTRTQRGSQSLPGPAGPPTLRRPAAASRPANGDGSEATTTHAAPHLHLGDGVAWLEAQPADSLDGIFSDPPWGAGPEIMGQATWQALLARVLWAAERVVRPDGHVMLWYGQAMLDPIFRYVLPHTRLHLNAILMIQYVPHRVFARYSSSDYIFVLGRMQFAPPRSNAYAFQEYVCNSHGRKDTEHPCARNQETVAQILRDWFRPGDMICDPFCGSDTTGWAARRLGVECYSFEIDPAIYRIAQARHAQQDLFTDAPACIRNPEEARVESKARQVLARRARTADDLPV